MFSLILLQRLLSCKSIHGFNQRFTILQWTPTVNNKRQHLQFLQGWSSWTPSKNVVESLLGGLSIKKLLGVSREPLLNNQHWEAQATNTNCPCRTVLLRSLKQYFQGKGTLFKLCLLCLSLIPILALLQNLFSVISCPPTWHTTILKKQKRCFSKKRFLQFVSETVNHANFMYKATENVFCINLSRQIIRHSCKMFCLPFNFFFQQYLPMTFSIKKDSSK